MVTIMKLALASVGVTITLFVAACSDRDESLVLAERADADHIIEAAMLAPADLGGDWCCVQPYIGELNNHCNATHWSSRRMVNGATTPGGTVPRVDVPRLYQVVLVVPVGKGSSCLAESLRQHEEGDFDWAPHEMTTLGDESFAVTLGTSTVKVEARHDDVVFSVMYATNDEEDIDIAEAEALTRLLLNKYLDIEDRVRRGEAIPSPATLGE